jgi:DNA-nicking Smr family endonuclease
MPPKITSKIAFKMTFFNKTNAVSANKDDSVYAKGQAACKAMDVAIREMETALKKETDADNKATLMSIVESMKKRRKTVSENCAKKVARDVNKLVHQIDLHKLHTDQAIFVLKNVLINEAKANLFATTDLKVITGKGLHSADGVPKVKPAVEIYLRNNDIAFCEVTGNPGVLLIKADAIAAMKERHQETVAKTPCKFYAAGTCRYGDRCKYAHEAAVAVKAAAAVDELEKPMAASTRASGATVRGTAAAP